MSDKDKNIQVSAVLAATQPVQSIEGEEYDKTISEMGELLRSFSCSELQRCNSEIEELEKNLEYLRERQNHYKDLLIRVVNVTG